ncbi:helix-turn-helix domain-containing protein [Anaerofustis stercorihominis]|uniref:helix-turn-helix domain-containing protein n=1 Tax=Anaerofustis stercorihominis TaxID=214853 RepID=UPI0026741EC9|nr:helix-turn-helix domain-containing protein [Anaerofustis stercorihominis]
MEEVKMLTVQEVANKLHKSTRAIRRGIIQGALPFGTCIKCEDENENNIFVIPKSRLEAWLEGKLVYPHVKREE